MAKSPETIARELADGEATPAVMVWRLTKVEEAVKEGFERHDAKLEALTSNFVTQEQHRVIEGRLASLESDRKWIVRLVIGAVVFSLLALIGIGFKVYR